MQSTPRLVPSCPSVKESDVVSQTSDIDWRVISPLLRGALVDLRAVEMTDAPALYPLLSAQEVSRFGTAPPASLEAFEQFIAWSSEQRREGRHLCFAIVPHDVQSAVGILQLRQLEPRFRTTEWGFAIGSAFWGSGIFMDSARLAIDFAFETLRAHRLEARAAITNGRGTGALLKLGAVQEGLLRRAFLRDGQYVDQALWSILDEDWREARADLQPAVSVH